jgi:hypothetical protein
MKAEKLMSLLTTVLLGLSAWTLKEVVNLKVQMAELKTQVSALSATNKNTQIAKR